MEPVANVLRVVSNVKRAVQANVIRENVKMVSI
jgi:hypothetical protein